MPKKGSHCGTPPAPCRNRAVGPRPARCSLIATSRTLSLSEFGRHVVHSLFKTYRLNMLP